MGIIRKLRQWREKQDGTLEGPAISTEVLQNAADGGAWETLKLAGYEEGDFVPLGVLLNGNGSASTSNNSYSVFAPSPDAWQNRLPLGLLTPSGAELEFYAHVTIANDNGDQLDVEISNATNVQIAEVLDVGSKAPVTIGPAGHTPPNPDDSDIFLRFKNQDNATTVSMQDVVLGYGVTL